MIRAVVLAFAAVTALSSAAVRAAEVHPAAWPAGAPPFAPDPALEDRISALLATMTVEEKVGQVIQADISTIAPDDLLRYPLGAVLAGGNSGPGNNSLAPPRDWRALAQAFRAAALARPGARIPPLFGIDAVHGQNHIVGATLFPHNIGLGAAHDPDLVRRIGAATAEEMRATGQDWTFAPCVAVVQDPRWGRTYESYSSDPALVASLGAALVEGLQGVAGSADFLSPQHVLATAKHFLGDGGTRNGTDEGDTQASEADLRSIHAAGYYATIAAGVQTVMASYSSWWGTPMHGNPALLTGVLRHRMGFDGFVIGDWNGHAHVPGCTPDDCPAAFLAGVDMFMAPDQWRGLFANMLSEARRGIIPPARLDEAVGRILRVKLRAGLFDAPEAPGNPAPPAGLGSPAHRALAREAVRKSLVLLKNEHAILPLSPRQTVLVTGDAADSIPRQSGGWTLNWQGTGTSNANFPNAQTIFAGIREAVTRGGGRAILSADGSTASHPKVAIVVFGEPPYAEMKGDRPSEQFGPGLGFDAPAPLATLRRLRAAGVPTVAVFLSGRPLDISGELAEADAFVAAWLPGGEGGGVADLLFRPPPGAVAQDFTGRLPLPWLDAFPLGFGLHMQPADSGSRP